MTDEIIFAIDQENIARLTLNRPQAHNAFHDGMLQKIVDIFKDIHEETSARALIIRGNGESFCAGADLSQMKRSETSSGQTSSDEVRLLSQMLYLFDTLPLPTIAFAHGAVMGGGIGILACADIVLADSQAIFGFSETKLGLVPAVIGPYVLKAIGARQARRFFQTGESFDAIMARQIGLVHEVITSDERENKIDLFLHHILTGAPLAIKEAKKFIAQMSDEIPENKRSRAMELITTLQHSEEAQQGITAFFDKVSPPWVPERFRGD